MFIKMEPDVLKKINNILKYDDSRTKILFDNKSNKQENNNN
jgi:hypothetical protein